MAITFVSLCFSQSRTRDEEKRFEKQEKRQQWREEEENTVSKRLKTKLLGLSPQAKYTDGE
jgi:hypothetical protein